MPNKIRPEVSTKNKYWVEKHRYYELKHFCLQYDTWKRAYAAIDGLVRQPPISSLMVSNTNVNNPTEKCVEEMEKWSRNIELVERVAIDTDETLSRYILMAVTTGASYDVLRVRHQVPCCRDVWYGLYRKFFWLLDGIKG